MVYCDSAKDCLLEDYPDVNVKCSTLLGGATDNDGHHRAGICVPAQCSTNVPCPLVGDECKKGVLSGFCKNDECIYDEFLAMATCISPPEEPRQWEGEICLRFFERAVGHKRRG